MYPHLFNILNLTYHQFQKLTEIFPNLKSAWEKSTKQDFIKIGLEPEKINQIIKIKKQINLQQEQEKLKKLKIKTITIENKNYPKLLKEIYDPPIILYYKGQIKPEDNFSISVVGARYHSFYGEKIISQIIPALIQHNLTIISGMAIGIDTLAHKAAIKQKGRTLAILGSGLDIIYPPHNKKLFQEIQEQGAVISEFPPGTEPHHYNFPRRNRIISGFSLGTLVIEGKEKSGSLITARLALEHSREVFAIPGSIHNLYSKGTNKLIQEGMAYPTHNATDILEKLKLDPLAKAIKPEIKFETKEEEKIYKILEKSSLNRNELHEKLNLEPSKINTLLSEMEIRGMIKNAGGVLYVK